MEFVLIKINSPLWNELWDELESHPVNQGIDNPSLAEYENNVWEYRGSFKQGNTIISDFLHRKHPRTEEQYVLTLKRELNNLDDIEKSIKI
jgi:nuclear transport factor 2 (NTF2) superfamily protein